MTLLRPCKQMNIQDPHSNPIGKLPFFPVHLDFPVPIYEIDDTFICEMDLEKNENFAANIAIFCIFRNKINNNLNSLWMAKFQNFL